MESNTKSPRRTTRLVDAAIDRGKLEAESAVAIAFAILKRRHSQRPEVRAKLLDIAARREAAT